MALVLTVVAGGLVALQAPINAGLGKATGGVPAALVCFVVGTLVLTVVAVVAGTVGGLGSTFDVQWYYLLGGALGAIYVVVALVTVSSIGAGGVAAGVVAGQLIASLAIDRAGLFGLDEIAISAPRLLGAGLLLLGTILIVR